jgi:hypothetical protein
VNLGTLAYASLKRGEHQRAASLIEERLPRVAMDEDEEQPA